MDSHKEVAHVAAQDERPTLDTVKAKPRVGHRVKIGERIGVICAPDDPQRAGTYTSATHGALPIKWLGNREERRKAAHEAKKRRRGT